jgi:hypothetical protein
MAIVRMCGWADQPPAPGRERSVIVCMEIGPDGLVRTTAQPAVSRIFAEIGVQIEWARDARACVVDEGIVVSLSYETPSNKYPNAWGYALPYERTHMVVFYDRVQKTIGETGAKNLLAYVLAHELTHMLQGVNRHSATGIMKAAWDRGDYFDMGRGALRFAPEDVRLLRMALEGRQARLAARTAGARE